MNTHQQCGKQYDLSYVMGAPKKGSVWFVGGLAVHRATEEWDTARFFDLPVDLPALWRRVFNEELEKQREKDPDQGGWRRAGIKADNPQGEDIAHWYSVLGPSLVESYIAWRRRSPWEIWTTPDGEPAIELDIGGTLPGMDGVQFKGFIDRVFYDRQFDRLHLVDLKTGTRKPEKALQLGIYGAAVQHRYGIPVPTGSAFMNRKGSLAEPWDLTKYTPTYVGRHFKQLFDAIQAGYFVPNTGRHCGMCDVSASCYANDGPWAYLYDRDHPDNLPEF
jgi:putative RecB family exonuclease